MRFESLTIISSGFHNIRSITGEDLDPRHYVLSASLLSTRPFNPFILIFGFFCEEQLDGSGYLWILDKGESFLKFQLNRYVPLRRAG